MNNLGIQFREKNEGAINALTHKFYSKYMLEGQVIKKIHDSISSYDSAVVVPFNPRTSKQVLR